jgi:predicted ATPase with chaperone activity
MMARRLPSILPNLTFEESLEITKIHSIAGILSENIALITQRPFRSPHSTVSRSFTNRRRKNSKTGRNKFSTFRSSVFGRITGV